MLRVSDLYNLDPSVTGTLVQVGGVLLSATFDNWVLADSIEQYDRGTAVPILDYELLKRLVMSGVYGIGGGRFAYRYQSVIEAVLAPGARGYKFALTNIVSLNVNYSGKDIAIIPPAEAGQSCEPG